MTTSLHVPEAGHDLFYTNTELMAYHGFGFPGGVAHGFKVLERALPLLSGGEPPSAGKSKSAPPSVDPVRVTRSKW